MKYSSEIEKACDDVIEIIQEGQWVLLDRRTGKIYTRDEYIKMCVGSDMDKMTA